MTLAGFVVAGSSEAVTNDVGELALLEYQTEYAGRRIVLDIYQVMARRTVSATLWSPADLAQADLNAGIQAIAIRERTWRYDTSADREALAAEIVAEVAVWLEQAPWAR